jgi:hypothetical protein
MTELAIISPAMRRLFNEIDGAAEPQSAALREIVTAYRTSKSSNADQICTGLHPAARMHCFIAELVGEGGRLAITRSGSSPSEPPLAELEKPRLLAALRRVLKEVGAMDEPLVIRRRDRLSHGEQVEFELFAGPYPPARHSRTFLCGIAFRRNTEPWLTTF